MLQAVPLRTHSCSKISVRDVTERIRSWVYVKNLLTVFTLTSAFSRQHYSSFKARMRPNLEKVHAQKVKIKSKEWQEEAKPGAGKSNSTVAFLKKILFYV